MENHRFTTIRMEIYGKSKISHSSPQSADCGLLLLPVIFFYHFSLAHQGTVCAPFLSEGILRENLRSSRREVSPAGSVTFWL